MEVLEATDSGGSVRPNVNPTCTEGDRSMPSTRQNHDRWTLSRAILLVICLIASMVVASSNATAKGRPPSGCLHLTGDTGSTTPHDDPVHDPATFQDPPTPRERPVHAPAIFKDPSPQTCYAASTGILQTPDNPGGIFLRRSQGSLA